MNRFLSAAAAAILLTTAACGSSGGGGAKLYIAEGSYGAPGILYAVDPEAGELEAVGPIHTAGSNYYPMTSLAMGDDGFLYGVTSSYSSDVTFLKIDPSDASAEEIELSGDEDCIYWVQDLEFVNGVFYGGVEDGFDHDGDNPCFIMLETDGTVTLLSDDYNHSEGGANAYDPATDTFYAILETLPAPILTIDLEDGSDTDTEVEVDLTDSDFLGSYYPKAAVFYQGKILVLVGSYYDGTVLAEVDPETGDSRTVMIVPNHSDAIALGN